MQEAWTLIGHKGAGQFKTSYSRGYHIADPALRLVQVFLGYNLLGLASSTSTITTPELYFMWCMPKKIKVHLGYWLAQSCHIIATHLVRHLYSCHLLGAYMERNVIMRLTRPTLTLTMCDAPRWFDLSFFLNTRIIKMKGSTPQFYEVGQPDWVAVKTEKEEAEATTSDKDWKGRMEAMMCQLGVATLAQREVLES